MNALHILPEEQWLTNNTIADIIKNKLYNTMFAEVLEWEYAIKEAKSEIGNSYDQLNMYISLGIIDEHKCEFSSLKNFFNSATNDFAGISETISEYKKELIQRLYLGEEFNWEEPALLNRHTKLNAATEDFLSLLNTKLAEFNKIAANTGYTTHNSYYSFEF